VPLGALIALSLAVTLTNCGSSQHADDDEDPNAGSAGEGGGGTGGDAGAGGEAGGSEGDAGADAAAGQGGTGNAGRGGTGGSGGSAGKGGGSAGKGGFGGVGGAGGVGGRGGGAGGVGGNSGTGASAGTAGTGPAGSAGTGGSSSGIVTFLWGEYRESLTDAASYVFPAVSLAPAGPDRLVVVTTHSASNTAVTYDAVTIGGVAAQKVASVGEELAPTAPTAFFVARLPSGETADIQMDLSATVVRGAIAVYGLYGVASPMPYDSGTSRAMNGGSIPINVPQGGVVLAALGMAADASGEAGWGTGLYELYDTVMIEGTPTHVAGAFATAAAADVMPFDVGIYTVSAGYETRAVAVSFR